MHPSRHLITIDDIEPAAIRAILGRAHALSTMQDLPQSLARNVVTLLFLQPSTRTRVGFQVAVSRLGGAAVEVTALKEQAGMEAPESLSDTVRVVADYSDLLVIRHPDMAALRQAVSPLAIPVINAGAGTEHHPTQTLIDLFAIQRHCGHLDGLRMGLVGDLYGSRSTHSLLGALRYYAPKELRLMTPAGCAPPARLLAPFPAGTITTVDHLALDELDVVYMAGLPAGAGGQQRTRESRSPFRLTPAHLPALPATSVILCPLPRIDEIDTAVDTAPQAGYFQQSAEGLFVRMAILEHWLTRKTGGGKYEETNRLSDNDRPAQSQPSI